MEKKSSRSISMGRMVCLATLLGIGLSMGGCGSGNSETVDNRQTTNQEDEVENDENNTLSESERKLLEVPINTNAEDIVYISVDDIDLSRAQHRCVSDGEYIYLAYGEPDLYVMPIGTDAHSPLQIENPDGLDICNIALDTYGSIHLLVAGKDNEEWFIWRLDENYQVDKTIDISTDFETKHMPLWFLIDKDGRYYFQWTLNRNGMLVDSEGVFIDKFTPESLGTKWIYEAAVGKDGEIYLLYGDSDANSKIGKFDVEKCLIEDDNATLYFTGNENFNAMSSGTDANLFLFSPYSGVWVYDYENSVMENRVSLTDIDFDDNTEFWPLTFLPDGRMILMERTISDNNDGLNSNQWKLKYIPVGK
ncbi:MAG: hypothetical protein R3Y24_16185 [Eubacteriales bacterium]